MTETNQQNQKSHDEPRFKNISLLRRDLRLSAERRRICLRIVLLCFVELSTFPRVHWEDVLLLTRALRFIMCSWSLTCGGRDVDRVLAPLTVEAPRAGGVDFPPLVLYVLDEHGGQLVSSSPPRQSPPQQQHHVGLPQTVTQTRCGHTNRTQTEPALKVR